MSRLGLAGIPTFICISAALTAAGGPVRADPLLTEDLTVNSGAVGVQIIETNTINQTFVSPDFNLVSPTGAVDVTGFRLETTTDPAAAQTGAVSTGPAGATGTAAYARCDDMSWGAACAQFFAFGNFTAIGGQNGADAQSDPNAVITANDQPGALTILASPGATPASYSIEVLQLASALQLTSTAFAAASTPLNGGVPFNLVLTVNGGTPLTIPVTDPTPEGLVEAINDADVGLVASIDSYTDTGGTSYNVSVLGQTGAEFGYTLTSERTLIDPDYPDAIADLTFAEPEPVVVGGVTYSPPGAQNAIYEIDGTQYESTTNEGIEVQGNPGVTLNLLAVSTGGANVAVTGQSGAVGIGLDNVTPGGDGNNVTMTYDAPNIGLPLDAGTTAFDLRSTGGQVGLGGTGGIGGQGGTGGPGLSETLVEISLLPFSCLFPTQQRLPRLVAMVEPGGKAGSVELVAMAVLAAKSLSI